MKLTLAPQQYFDGEGKPLVGRLSVHARGTDSDFVKIYTFADGEYSEAENPQYLDSEGRLPSAVYFEVTVVTVKLERYTGGSAMESDDDPSHWELVDTYDYGFEWTDPVAQATATSIDELRLLGKDSSPVLVTGYYDEGDSPARFYVWDENCRSGDDGGYVIASSANAGGRWIMLWDGDEIPCTLYGVFDGDGRAENLQNLLNYPWTVGYHGLATANRIRFVTGQRESEYDNGTVARTTLKELVFDARTKFDGAGKVTCGTVTVIGEHTSFVGDFVLTGVASVAHSSWFRTADAFWGCKAKRLVVDSANHFEDPVVNDPVNVSNTAIECRSEKGIAEQYYNSVKYPSLYADGAYLSLIRCTVEGTPFGKYDRLKFTKMTFDQSWFSKEMTTSEYSFGKLADGARIECAEGSKDGGNSVCIERFLSAGAWVYWAAANGKTDIDLHGRECSLTAIPSPVSVVRNGRFDGFGCDRSMTFQGCAFSGKVTASGSDVSLSFDRCSVAEISADKGTCVLLSLTDSAVNSGSVTCCPVAAIRSTVGFSIADGDPDGAYEGKYPVNLRDCTAVAEIACEDVAIFGSTVSAGISVYPFIISGDRGDHIGLRAAFSGNTFEGDGKIAFMARNVPSTRTRYVESLDSMQYVFLTVTNNQFSGDVEGITMPYLLGVHTDRVEQDFDWAEAPYVATDAAVSCTYAGNRGSCPAGAFAGERDLSFDSEIERYYSAAERVFAISSAYMASGYVASSSSYFIYGASNGTGAAFINPSLIAYEKSDSTDTRHAHSPKFGVSYPFTANDMFNVLFFFGEEEGYGKAFALPMASP